VARKQETGKVFVSRPLGILFRKMPNYVWAMGRLISKYYNVKYIQMHHYGETYRHAKYIEIFGEPHHLDIAEYVFYFLMFEAERQWNEFKKSALYNSGYHGKIAWISSFVQGFWNKLQTQQEKMQRRMDAVESNCQSLIWQYDTILNSHYRNCYPNLCTISTNTTRRRSGSGGYEAGQNTSIRTAVRGGKVSGLMLT
jgi:hypothetical protein